MARPKLSLKKIHDQVIVITGASSGIGLATALMAAQRGASVVLASRNAQDLDRIVSDIKAKGGKAIAVTTDVSKFDDVKRLRDLTIEVFGRIDTWVNNAAASVFGDVLDVPEEELRQIFETNFWGVHYGCKVAVEAMTPAGGMIINIGSEVSERSMALQTVYSASKHAVKAYTEGLRTELEKKNIPIGFTLIRPAGIDTPFTEHAVNRLESGAPSLPSPVYHPDIVAQSILACAQSGKRDVFVGGASKFFSKLEHLAPRVADLLIELKIADDQKKGSEIPHTRQNEGLLQVPLHEGLVRGGHKGHVSRNSLWTSMSLHPVVSAAALTGLGLVAFGWLMTQQSRTHPAGVGKLIRLANRDSSKSPVLTGLTARMLS